MNFKVNSFQLPNEFVDKLMGDMSALEIKCYLFITRKTVGWGKEYDRISLSQFQKAGISKNNRTHLLKALNSLSDKKLIFIGEKTKGKTTEYSLCKTSDEKSPVTSDKINPSTSDEKSLVASDEKSPTKDTITKDTITKEKINKKESAFEEFHKRYPRAENKAVAKKSFMKLSIKKIEELIQLLPAIQEKYKYTEKKFIPLLATFLRQERYEDEYFQQYITNTQKNLKKGGEILESGHAQQTNPLVASVVVKLRDLSDGEEVQFDEQEKIMLTELGWTAQQALEEYYCHQNTNVMTQVIEEMLNSKGKVA